MLKKLMSRFGNLLKTGRIVRAAAMIAIFLSTLPVTAAKWSFEDHPHPFERDYTETERQYLLASDREPDDGKVCMVALQSQYRIYRERYPEYEKTGDPITNFENWKRHLVHSDKKYIPICLFIEQDVRLFELTRRRPFFFCGRSLDDPSAPYDEDIEAQFNKMLDFANSGRSFAVSQIVNTYGTSRIIGLNRDVEYYFRKIVRVEHPFDDEFRDTSHLDPYLDPERKAFVDEAVKTRDLAAVMATTAPCNPPPSPKVESTKIEKPTVGSILLQVLCLLTGLGCKGP